MSDPHRSPPTRITVGDRWFWCLKSGEKIYEGRRRLPKIEALSPGDSLIVGHHTDPSVEPFELVVDDTLHFRTFEEALRTLPMEEILPGCQSVEEGVGIYLKFVSLATQEREGVVVLKLRRR